jgi:hypothetical protein
MPNTLLDAIGARAPYDPHAGYAGWGRSGSLIDLAEGYLLRKFDPASAMNILGVASYLEQAIRQSYAARSEEELSVMEHVLQRVASKYGGLGHTAEALKDFRAKLAQQPKTAAPAPHAPEGRDEMTLEEAIASAKYRLSGWEEADFASILATIAGIDRYQRLYQPFVQQPPGEVSGRSEYLKKFVIIPESVTPSAALLAFDANEKQSPYLRSRVLLSLQKNGKAVKFPQLTAELLYTPAPRPLSSKQHGEADMPGSFPAILRAAQEAADQRLSARAACAYIRDRAHLTLQNDLSSRNLERLLARDGGPYQVTIENLPPESALQQHTRPNWAAEGVRIRVTFQR